MLREQQKFILDDGRYVTPGEVAKEIRSSVSGARARLKKSSDPKYVFRKGRKSPYSKSKRRLKTFELSDGSVMTADDVSNKYNIELRVARSRLSSGIRDIDKLKKPVRPHKKSNKYLNKKFEYKKDYKPSKEMEKRMFYDPLGHWKLINKYI